MRPVRCPSVVTLLFTARSRHLLPKRRQGDLVSRRADPPSQDRRSLGYLVSTPPLATDHESRLHQLAGDADLTPRIASGSQCSDQRSTVIGETVGWRLQEPSEDTITQGTDLLLQQ